MLLSNDTLIIIKIYTVTEIRKLLEHSTSEAFEKLLSYLLDTQQEIREFVFVLFFN